LKAHIKCAPCLLNRGYLEIERASKNQNVRFKAMVELLKLLNREFSPEACPSIIGTKRDRLVRKITGNDDPYRELKHESNVQALKLFPRAQSLVQKHPTSLKRFRAACMVALAGNLIEFDIIGHNFNFNLLEDLFMNVQLGVDDINKIYELLSHSKKVMFLTDNAGEIVFDAILTNEIRNSGVKVIVAVKEKPVLNDATMEDALEVGIQKFADEVITTGTDTLGLILSEASEEFRKKLKECDLIIAKGMANYETLPEEKTNIPIAFLLMAKCDPVALNLGVKKGSAVAKLIMPKTVETPSTLY